MLVYERGFIVFPPINNVALRLVRKLPRLEAPLARLVAGSVLRTGGILQAQTFKSLGGILQAQTSKSLHRLVM